MKQFIERCIPALVALAATTPLHAQTDYYNTDAGRPVRIEDAYPTERYAFELQLAPLRVERLDDGAYRWEIEPEIAYGILPRTHLEIGFPLVLRDERGVEAAALAGVDVSMLHNLNVETTTVPAFAVAADVTLPAGGMGPDRIRPSLTGIATRTFSRARVHLNGRYTLGPDPASDADPGEVSRWMAGVAVDRTFPIRALLLIGDVYAEQSIDADEKVAWTAEAGIRYQISPFFALDAGLGRRFSGAEQGWSLTFGAARAFAIRSLIPVPQ